MGVKGARSETKWKVVRMYFTSGRAAGKSPREIAKATWTSYHLVQRVMRAMIEEFLSNPTTGWYPIQAIAEELHIPEFYVRKYRRDWRASQPPPATTQPTAVAS